MKSNKTVLRGVVVIAMVGLLAGLQIAGASPKTKAKTAKHAQKASKNATAHQNQLQLPNATLSADHIDYKYEHGEINSVQAQGHVKLVAQWDSVPDKLVVTSDDAVFAPIDLPTYPQDMWHLVVDSMPNFYYNDSLDGTVYMTGNVHYQYNENMSDEYDMPGVHVILVPSKEAYSPSKRPAIAWLSYSTGALGCEASFTLPEGPDGMTRTQPIGPLPTPEGRMVPRQGP